MKMMSLLFFKVFQSIRNILHFKNNLFNNIKTNLELHVDSVY